MFLLTVYFLPPLHGAVKSATFGGKAGWGNLTYAAGIGRGTGRFGYQSLELEKNTNSVDQYTDLWLDFEAPLPEDRAKNYTLRDSKVMGVPGMISHTKAAFASGKGGIILDGGPRSLFGQAGVLGSFTIEVWIRPSVAGSGETVFQWRSSRIVDAQTRGPRGDDLRALQQLVSGTFYQSRFVWTFTNIFDGYSANGGEISLTSRRVIIPSIWAHHRVSFDVSTGALEYCIDGQMEAIAYLTTTGAEGGTVLVPISGAPAELNLCQDFFGSIDDLRIIRTVGQTSYDDDFIYLPGGGHRNLYDRDGNARFETTTVTAAKGSVFESLSALLDTPPETGVQFFVRAGNDPLTWTSDEPPWIPVTAAPNSSHLGFRSSSRITGEAFQVAAALYSDGAGTKSPRITQITLNWKEEPLPLPPFEVQAQAGDGTVTLIWTASVDSTTAGYLVYYGERPGEYLGRIAAEGESPINAGNTRSFHIHGLQNGRIYYFAVAAVSQVDKSVTSELSKEIYARPFPRGTP
ncbi:MAG: fibronectin type III domain-containing protein [Spirochaetaceae bacterium]|nr:fibronectin type III domain-containing protein [Spirochaetaceae bacterium]